MKLGLETILDKNRDRNRMMMEANEDGSQWKWIHEVLDLAKDGNNLRTRLESRDEIIDSRKRRVRKKAG